MNGTRTLAVVSLLLTFATLSFAEQTRGPVLTGAQYDDVKGAGNPALQGQDKAISEKQRKELHKKVDAVRIWKLTEALNLDDDTSARLSAILSATSRKRTEVQRDQRESLRALQQALKASKPDESKIKAHLEKLEAAHLALEQLRSQEMSGMKNILTAEQQARYLLFQQEFRREMRGMIESARSGSQDRGDRAAHGGPRSER